MSVVARVGRWCGRLRQQRPQGRQEKPERRRWPFSTAIALAALGTGCLCSPAPVPSDAAHPKTARQTARGRPTSRPGEAATRRSPDVGPTTGEGGSGAGQRAGAAGPQDAGRRPAGSGVLPDGDYWLARFGPYMSVDEQRAYRKTPPAMRYERFAPLFLDLAERERLLQPVKARCGPDDARAYWRLPDLAACAAWIKQRFPHATGEGAGER